MKIPTASGWSPEFPECTRRIFGFLLFAALASLPTRSDSAQSIRSAFGEAQAAIKHDQRKLSPCATPQKTYLLPVRDCRDLRRVDRILDKLLGVAGFSQGSDAGKIQLYIERGKPADYALFYQSENGSRYLAIGEGLLAADESTIVDSLSHEAGHAVQRRDIPQGTLKTYTSRQVEAHADLVGAQIAYDAGYSLVKS